jgi:hypothetical protein
VYDKSKSITETSNVNIISDTITTVTDPANSCLEGHATFFNSFLQSTKNRAILPNIFLLLFSFLAGQEGFEPPTSGFGDRRSTSWSY